MHHVVNAVLFDLDNTLADRDEAFTRWARWFASAALGFQEPAEIETLVANLIVLDAGGYTPRDTFARAVKAQHGGLTDDVETLTTAFRAQLIAHLPPLDVGAATLLAVLDDARVPWGIVTNGSSLSQLAKIRKLALADRAGCVLISEEVGIRKPDAEIFFLAAGRLGVSVSDVLFVGDHPEVDIAGAAKTGMRTAWLRLGRTWPADLAPIVPDLIIDSLRELIWVASDAAGHE